MLKTRSTKAERHPSDGKRIAVMGRNAVANDLNPNPEATPSLCDEWWPQLAPPALIANTYRQRGLTWNDFRDEYREYLKQATVATRLIELIDLAKNDVVTVLCVKDKPDRSYRRILAEECLLMQPDLEVEIR